MKPLRVLLLYGLEPGNTLSYHAGWPKHFLRHRSFDCLPLNLLDRRGSARLRAHAVTRLRRFDAIVLLHSTFSNMQTLAGPLLGAVEKAPQPKAYFIGNEYKSMPEKMDFCARLGLALFVTQSHSLAVQAMYRERLGCPVIGIPNTGLDQELFFPRTEFGERDIDLGYRSADAPLYAGHDERKAIGDFFLANAGRYRLRVDISLSNDDRFAPAEWARFLDRCRGQLGTESGLDYFELTDETRAKVNAYIAQHPDVTREEIHRVFFRAPRPSIPMRIVSGRNVEAAGTKTVQIMFEGEYGGYFLPDQHYIPVRKDFSDADDAMAKFCDPGHTMSMREAAYALVVENFTYDKLIDRFHAVLRSVI